MFRVVLAATSMVALAFVIPLGLLAKQIAHDRALSDAQHDAAAAIVAIAAADSRSTLISALRSLPVSVEERLAVHLPDEMSIGVPRASPADLALVQDQEVATVVDAEVGLFYLQPTVIDGAGVAVIEVYVPNSELWRGVVAAWLAMSALAVVLVAASVVLADRLGTKVVRSARELARGARALGSDLSARVRVDGTPELSDAGAAFNAMADRVGELVAAERERAADLSHRLRTPLTALRLDVDALPPGQESDRIRESVDALDEEIDAIISNARRPLGEPVAEPTDLVDVLAARLAFWTVLAEHQQRAWEIWGNDEPVLLSVPRDDLTAAIDALLGNVFRHTPHATSFKVTITSEALIVEDAGPGFPKGENPLDRGVSSADSTGLGLDIVQWVAEQAGGSVQLGVSTLGGARVMVNLPMLPW